MLPRAKRDFATAKGATPAMVDDMFIDAGLKAAPNARKMNYGIVARADENIANLYRHNRNAAERRLKLS